MKTRTATTILMAMVSTLLFAIPARKKPFVMKQVDGSTLTVVLVGDEHMHYYATTDGTPLVREANGMYRQATYFEAQNIKARRAASISQNNARRAKRSAARRAASTFTGEKRGLVILVNFKDTKMKSTSTVQAFYELFNKSGYNENGHIGSVRDYFLEQSYGKLTIDFDVVGPYTLSNNMKYYGEDYDGEEGADTRPAEMIIEAMRMANSDVNYKDYDWNGDGEVDQVYVIYAGYNQAHGADANTIWPHEWDLESAEFYGDGTGPLTLDGVKLNTYACSSELIGTSGSTISTIGTAVHEFSHCLGLPDLYDTEGDNFALDSWSVMSSGSYNGPDEWGEVPAGYTSYERMFAGWLTPTELDSPAQITAMQSIATHPEAYIIYNEKNKNEYYLLENRQLERFDSYLYGHGMLVLHVDYDKTAWEENTVNNVSNHQRCTIIPADNQFMSGNSYGYTYATASDLEGDPYPGPKKNTALTDTSRPAATLYNANSDGRKFMGKPIEKIEESESGVISFVFMGGMAIETPTLQPETTVEATAFTANWQPVADADHYVLQLRYLTSVNIAEMHLLGEDFSGLASYSNDGNQDIGTTLDKYMQTSGWTGTKVYTSASRLKLGSSKVNGTLTSPTITAPKSTTVTIRLLADNYSTKTPANVEVIILSTNGTRIASQSLDASKKAQVITFDGIDQDFAVKLAPTARIYVSAFDVYDGAYTADQLDSEGLTDYYNSETFTTANTSYTFTGLDPEKEYSYRIQAIVEGFASPWTEWTTPTSGTDFAAEDVNHDGTIDTQDVLAIYDQMQTTANPGTIADVNHDGTVDTQDVLAVYAKMQSK